MYDQIQVLKEWCQEWVRLFSLLLAQFSSALVAFLGSCPSVGFSLSYTPSVERDLFPHSSTQSLALVEWQRLSFPLVSHTL